MLALLLLFLEHNNIHLNFLGLCNHYQSLNIYVNQCKCLLDDMHKICCHIGLLDLTEVGLGIRGQRYASLIKDGCVQQIYIEPDATLVTVSGAEAMLGRL